MAGSGKWVACLAHAPVFGSALRWLGSRWREGSVTTIRYGPAAGLRWRRSHRYVNGYWLGTYETEVQAALVALVRPGMRVFDIGANAGFFSVLLARLVGPTGQVIAVDPDPTNIESLRAQAALNPDLCIEIVQAAIGAKVGRARLAAQSPGSPMATVVADASDGVGVTVLTLDRLDKVYGQADFVKMDIEGAEVDALAGAAELLARGSTAWLVETHGSDRGRAVWHCLTSAGCQPHRLAGQQERVGDVQAADHIVAARPSPTD